jgi:hypothetical protein
MMTRKEVCEALGKANIGFDKLGKDREGRWTFRMAFFYTHGNSAKDIAERIRKAIPSANIEEAYDEWKRWPTTSYFVVKFKA